MAGELVFITGASGHLGLRVLVSALEAGYRVRAAVRSQEKANKILAAPSIKTLNPGSQLTFATVHDMSVDGAYDEAIKGVTYAIHVASPITSAAKEGDDFTEVLVKPAVSGTLNLLEAAKKAGTLKRVVITSSIVAQMPFAELTSGKTDKIYNEKSRTVFKEAPYDNIFDAYAASKIKALNDSEAWIQKEKPGFDLVNVHPAFIIGKDELVTNTKDALIGTNAEVLQPALGIETGYVPGASIHVVDVADAHVKALEPHVPGNSSLILNSGWATGGTKWEEVKDIVAREFPEAVKKGLLKNDGNIITVPVRIDERYTEKVLGFKFKGLEEQTKSVVGHYLELLGEPKA